MTALPLLLVLLLIAASAGRRVLQLARIQTDARLDRAVYSTGLGLGVIAYAVFALGMLGLVHLSAVLITLAVIAAAAWPGLPATLRDLRPPYRRPSALTLAAAAALALFAVIAIVACHVPPAAHEWDALSYHLADVKVWLQHGRIVFLPTDHHSNFPFLQEMLFMLGLMLQGTTLAALTHFATGAIAVAALFAIGRRHFAPAAGTVAAVAFASAPVVLWESGVAYIDVAQAMYVLLALGAALDYRARRDARLLALSGAFMGFALAVKTLSLIPLVLFAALLLVERTPLRRIALYGAFAIVVGCPFYVKTWALTGNPVYPFAYRVFGGRYWNQALANAYAATQGSFGLNHVLLGPMEELKLATPPVSPPTLLDRVRNTLLAPFKLVSVPRIYYDWGDIGFDSHLGFLFLALPPLLALVRGPSSAAKWTAALCALWFVGWALTMQYVRYLIPLLGPLMLVGGEGAVRIARGSRALGALTAGVVALQVALTAWVYVPKLPEQWSRAASPEARQDYLMRSVNSYASMQWLNENTPPSAGVILFDEVRGFYLDRPYLWGNSLHSLYIPYTRFADGRAMVVWFLAHGYRYALVNLVFKNPPPTEQDLAELRQATATGDLLPLMLRWYNPADRASEPQRWLLGDALRDGSAVILPQASFHDVVVIEFRPPDRQGM